MIHVDSTRLAAEMRAVLLLQSVDADSVEHVVSSLIQTSLRGVDSHGIQLFPHYCRAVAGGRINAHPAFRAEQTAPATAILDADHAFGHHAGVVAMDLAIKIAKTAGTCAVAVRNSTHFGAAAYFALRAPPQGCLGFAFTNADALVKAHNAQGSFFGTNPICFTAPLAGEEPFCLDMATSLVAWNKILNYRRMNKSIPPRWACDEFGHSVTDPHKARALYPSGDYKGFGLGMMVDILCALLAGGPIGKDLLPMYSDLSVRRNVTHFFMAVDIDKFLPSAAFSARLQEMVDRLRSMAPLDPDTPVLVPGDPEKRNHRHRLAHGIPVDEAKFEEFLKLSPNFSAAVIG